MHPLFHSATLLLAAQMTFYAGFGQIGIETNTPDPNSALTIFSTTKGVLIPRLSKAEQTTLAGTLTIGETGMLIADSASGDLWLWSGNGGHLSAIPVAHLAQGIYTVMVVGTAWKSDVILMSRE